MEIIYVLIGLFCAFTILTVISAAIVAGEADRQEEEYLRKMFLERRKEEKEKSGEGT